MCQMCRDNNGEMESCPDCCALICFDIKGGDDLVAGAFITETGDVFCARCGEKHEGEAAREAEDEAGYFADPSEEVL